MSLRLSGNLICRNESEVDVVRRFAPDHIELTRSEPGCLAFVVEPTEDALVWRVDERFVDRDAFDAHQARVVASAWGSATAHLQRHYEIEEVI